MEWECMLPFGLAWWELVILVLAVSLAAYILSMTGWLLGGAIRMERMKQMERREQHHSPDTQSRSEDKDRQ